MRRARILLGERPGSGDGERKTLLTRQTAFGPLPASVLFGLGLVVIVIGLLILDGSKNGA
jgi:hypothetical protein